MVGNVKKGWEKKAGFIFSYFLFTTLLYCILIILNKKPINWSYFHVMGITLLIVLIGTILKRSLK